MHLVINASGVKHSGGAVVLLDFLHEALRHEQIDKVSVLCSPRAVRQFDLPLVDKCISLEQSAAERSYLYRILWAQFILPRFSNHLIADAFICLVGIGLGGSSLKRTLFLQQSLPFVWETLPYLTKRQRIRLHVMWQLMRRASHHADRVIVQTPTMQQWVSTAFHLPEGKCAVVQPTPPIPILTNDAPHLLQLLHAPAGCRLLNVGSGSPHKNLAVLVEGIVLLRKAVPEATLFLTLPVDHPLNQMAGVECIGYLSGSQLWQAYQLSDVLVMASLVETVGLSMLEALSVATPVLAADRPYAHDICGEAALFFDPLSAEDFARQAHTLLTNTILQKRIASQGKKMIVELRERQPYKEMVDIAINPNK
jgi:glycosyltransferase involved in cell wall biosynthesis